MSYFKPVSGGVLAVLLFWGMVSGVGAIFADPISSPMGGIQGGGGSGDFLANGSVPMTGDLNMNGNNINNVNGLAIDSTNKRAFTFSFSADSKPAIGFTTSDPYHGIELSGFIDTNQNVNSGVGFYLEASDGSYDMHVYQPEYGNIYKTSTAAGAGTSYTEIYTYLGGDWQFNQSEVGGGESQFRIQHGHDWDIRTDVDGDGTGTFTVNSPIIQLSSNYIANGASGLGDPIGNAMNFQDHVVLQTPSYAFLIGSNGRSTAASLGGILMDSATGKTGFRHTEGSFVPFNVPSYASIYASSETIVINTVDTETLASAGWVVNETNGPSYNGTTGTFTIQAGGAGVYILSFSVSLEGGNLALIHWHTYVGGVKDNALHIERKLSAGGDVGSMGVSAPVTLAVGDTIKLMAEQDTTTTNQTVNHGSFWINRISN